VARTPQVAREMSVHGIQNFFLTNLAIYSMKSDGIQILYDYQNDAVSE
jgi:hypothetical protein